MIRDRDWIAARIPHQGPMCLLAEVLALDAAVIRCRATSHRDPGNPLRAHGRLGASCGIEYAAQAMALHAYAAGSEPPAPSAALGLIASVRNVALYVARLDDIAGDLIATAERVHADARSALYDFTVAAPGRLLLRGRAAVLLQGGAHVA